MDEATASLDAETSFEVLDAILKLDGCTRPFALKNGAVSEQGTFGELMEQKGYFYSLFTVSQINNG